MHKRLIMILALAFVVAVAGAAFAEVQNVKVSGDITVLGVGRNNYNLGQAPIAGNKVYNTESFLATIARLRVDADLTDNVMTTVRLINERAWETETQTSTDIDLDLAFVTLKEFLYSPLNLTIGRQEIAFGNKLIIGAANTYAVNVLNGLPSDLSLRKAFDALRATLNYDPLVIDLIYAKIDENTLTGASGSPENDDINLYGVNATYMVDKNTNVQGYAFLLKDGNVGGAVGVNVDKPDTTYTVGALLTNTSVKDLKASLEAAFQFGNSRVSSGDERDRRAWALQAMADYSIPIEKIKKHAPVLSLGYTYLSGDKDSNDTKTRAWNAMYEDQALNTVTNFILPYTNLSVINAKGSVKPVEDVTLIVNYGNYYLAKKVASGTTFNSAKADASGGTYNYTMNSGKKFLGNAVDVSAVYDYTEDVQIGLTCGMFFPGKALDNHHNANQVLGSMKVTF